jgi:hypothetical protein
MQRRREHQVVEADATIAARQGELGRRGDFGLRRRDRGRADKHYEQDQRVSAHDVPHRDRVEVVVVDQEPPARGSQTATRSSAMATDNVTKAICMSMLCSYACRYVRNSELQLFLPARLSARSRRVANDQLR